MRVVDRYMKPVAGEVMEGVDELKLGLIISLLCVPVHAIHL